MSFFLPKLYFTRNVYNNNNNNNIIYTAHNVIIRLPEHPFDWSVTVFTRDSRMHRKSYCQSGRTAAIARHVSFAQITSYCNVILWTEKHFKIYTLVKLIFHPILV